VTRSAAAARVGIRIGLTVFVLSLAADLVARPLIVVPLSLTALLVAVAPTSALASPPVVFRGYAAALLSGSAMTLAGLPSAAGAAAAAAFATALMAAAGTVHPPAAALAILLGRGEADGARDLLALCAVVVIGVGVLLLPHVTRHEVRGGREGA